MTKKEFQIKIRFLIRLNGIILTLFILTSMNNGAKQNIKLILYPEKGVLMTHTIQLAIDSCASVGGGVVVFTEGTFISGGLLLKNNVTLQLKKGAILQGSENYSDYQNDAFIYGKGLTNIAIKGDGIIDGVDCYNPNGEEGFRGPHCIRLISCSNLLFQDFTIENSANWAFNLRHCSFGTVENITIRGGHDGLHTRFCNNFSVSNCDFRTGDDAFAGNDNQDFVITDCKINTSCNGFRMGCLNLKVKRCHLWGPGESVHKVQKRNNMLAAFVHFSPKDENPKLKSGNWLIEDITVENVDRFYVYNYEDGLWQTGQPATKIHFSRVKATGILNAFSIIGDEERQFSLDIENSSFSFREEAENLSNRFEGAELRSGAFFNASRFDTIELLEVIFNNVKTSPVLDFTSGNLLIMEKINYSSEHITTPYSIEKVEKISLIPVN